MSRPIAMTIAGSDSGGGAGVQADLRTFAALGVHGTSAITALTAQSTTEVRLVTRVEPAMVRAQIETVLDDMAVSVAKTGMLYDADIVKEVDDVARARGLSLVVDPVMIATSGARLIDDRAIEALVERLLPTAVLVTPNLPEAAALAGRPVATRDDMVAAAEAIFGLGARAVLVKGGHLASSAADLFAVAGEPPRWLEAPRVETRHTHGTGCTLSAAIAAFLARGFSLEAAVRAGKAYLDGALRAGASLPPLGRGAGPVHHLFALMGGPRS